MSDEFSARRAKEVTEFAKAALRKTQADALDARQKAYKKRVTEAAKNYKEFFEHYWWPMIKQAAADGEHKASVHLDDGYSEYEDFLKQYVVSLGYKPLGFGRYVPLERNYEGPDYGGYRVYEIEW